MADCEPVNFADVDEEKWQCAKDVVRRKYGVDVQSDSGKASRMGLTLTWSYDPTARTLVIQCTKRFVISCEKVKEQIEAAATECGFAV